MSRVACVFRRATLAVSLAAGVIACGDSSTQPSWDGQVRVAGSVLDFRTHAPVGGARITIGGATAATEASGGYSLNVAAGEQRVSVDGELIATSP